MKSNLYRNILGMVAAMTWVGVMSGWSASRVEPPVLPDRLDLATALDVALAWNPGLNRTREELAEQDGALMTTRSDGLPQVQGFGSYTWEEESRSGSFGGPEQPDQDNWRVGVEATQPLYYGGVLRAATDARILRNQALGFEVEAEQVRVIADVYRAFYRALLAREVIVVQEEALTLLEQQLALARNRFEAGSAPRFDVLQAEVQVSGARPPLIRARNNYRLAVDELRTQLGAVYAEGQTPDTVVLDGTLEIKPFVIDLPDALAEARMNRPEVLALEQRRAAAEKDVIRASHQRSPRVSAYVNYFLEKERFASDVDRLEGWQAGLEASVPIWESGRIRGEVAQALSRSKQIEWDEDALRLSIELDVRTAWNRSAEAGEVLAAVEQVIVQAEEAVRLAENRYRVGALTQLDVLVTQLELTRAKLERITAIHDYLVAVIDLQQAMGRIPSLQGS